ncbi:MAG: tetratricopeptide repeat protein [Bacteroidales bacterium]|nr:tetratricopeptide repeat protein [Bacteroidales bacterium]
MKTVFWLLFPGLFIILFLWSCQNQNEGNQYIENNKKVALADSLNLIEPGKADSIYRQVMRDSSAGNAKNRINAMVGLSDVFLKQGKLDSTFTLLNQSYLLAQSVNDTVLLMKILLSQGNFQLETGDNDKTEQYFLKGLSLARKVSHQQYINNFLLSLGSVQHVRGKFPEAIKTFTEGVKVAEQSGNERNEATALENLAFALKSSGELRLAIGYIKKSLEIRKKLNLEIEYTRGLMNLGIFYRNFGQNDSALACYRQAYNRSCEIKDTLLMIKTRYNIGIILKNEGKYREAENEMNEILDFCRRKNIIDGRTFAYSALASIYEQTGRLPRALAVIDTAIKLSREKHLTQNMVAFLDRRHEILMKSGQFKEAYQCVLESKHLSDSLLSVDKQNEIAALQTRFDTDRKEAENILLRKDLEVQKSRVWVQRICIILGMLAVLVVLIIIYFRYKQVRQGKLLAEEKNIRTEQEKLKKEVELENAKLEKRLKEEELDKAQLEGQLREERIEQLELQGRLKEQELVYQTLVRTDLTQLNRSVQGKLTPYTLKISRKKDQEDFAQTLSEITRDASKDPMSEFEILFRQLHASFYEKLLQHCSDLSRTELQVCALIRLNLSSKDIARLVNISVSTVESTRHHIRKKLELETGDNLTSFLFTL